MVWEWPGVMAEPVKHWVGGAWGDRRVKAWAPTPSRTVPSLHASSGWSERRRAARCAPSSVGTTMRVVGGKRWEGMRLRKVVIVSVWWHWGHAVGSGGGACLVNGRYRGK